MLGAFLIRERFYRSYIDESEVSKQLLGEIPYHCDAQMRIQALVRPKKRKALSAFKTLFHASRQDVKKREAFHWLKSNLEATQSMAFYSGHNKEGLPYYIVTLGDATYICR